MIALVVGTLLAVGALAFVLYPMFFEVRDEPGVRRRDDAAREDSAIVALREIEFDRATGKLSDADYAELKGTYAARALQELRAADPSSPPPTLDAIEARVRAYRTAHRDCPTCGLRPEADAIYCSTCGGFLDGACAECGAPVTEASATYCSVCGAALRAIIARSSPAA